MSPFTAGLTVESSLSSRLTPQLNSKLQAEYHSNTTQGGSTVGQIDYTFAPFKAGAGLKYAFGDTYGLGGVINVGYNKNPISVEVTHTQPFVGNIDVTTVLGVRYNFTPSLSLELKDQINWTDGSNNDQVTHVANLRSLANKIG